MRNPQLNNKLHLPRVEFYINNLCNFNCTGCNRFNNYAFNGIQEWAQYEKIYSHWASLLEFDEFTILGGEPMLNPTYMDWLTNVCRLWPNATGFLLTNGHYLKPDNRVLYDFFSNNHKVHLQIGLHNIDRTDTMLDTVKQWLCGPLTITREPENIRELPGFDLNWISSYNTIKDHQWPECPTVDDWDQLPDAVKTECQELHKFSPAILANTRRSYNIVDSNGVRVLIAHEDYFHQGALINNQNKSFSLHNSDPVKAHDMCHSKTCHHFDKGELYKCGQVALFKEIDQQFYLDATDSDRDLINSYASAKSTDNYDKLSKFINTINDPLPQCKFCPDSYNFVQINALHGQKIKMVRKQKQ